MILASLGLESTWGLRPKAFVGMAVRCSLLASPAVHHVGQTPPSFQWQWGIHSSNGFYLCHGRNKTGSSLCGCPLFDCGGAACHSGVSHHGRVFRRDALSLTSPSVIVMPRVAWLFFGHCVDCFVVLQLIRVPWLRVRSITVSCLFLLIHFIYSSSFPGQTCGR